MNVEVPDHTVPELSEEQARPMRKVLRPLNPEAALQKSQIDEPEKESSIVFFRLKRTAEYEPSDILALDGMNMPLISKKHQAKHIRDLENEINKLDINKEKEVNEEMKENENNKEKKLLEGLLFSEDSQMDMKFVLKRIDPQNIYDLEKDEEAFRKNYKTMYNDINSKQKRDNILNQRRKNLLENPTNENGDNKKDAKKIKIYDINLKEEFKQNVLFCNNNPMVVTNLLEIAKKDKIEEEVDDNNYAYYAFRKVPKKMATGAQEVKLHDSAKGVLSSHLAEEEQEFMHEGQDKDSDYEYKNDVDNRDSNAESNSEFEYPDEEEVEGSHSRDPWSDSEKQRNNYYDENDDEFDQNNEDYDEEEDEDIMFKDKKFHEEKFKSNFWSKVKDMSKEDME